MPDPAVCWKCGASLAQLSLPLLRHDCCATCGADLHVCKLCRFYDVIVAKQCREPIAELVRDKERANYCDYFQIKANAFIATHDASAKARAELDALFGHASTASDASDGAADKARAALDELFGKKS